MTDDTRDRLLMAVASALLAGEQSRYLWQRELIKAYAQAQRERDNPAEAR